MRIFAHKQNQPGRSAPSTPVCSCAATSKSQQRPTLQTKLAISEPGDALEQEADRVANNVLRMPAGRACGSIQRAPSTSASGSMQGSGAPSIVQDVLSSSGRPLDAATRTFMEPRFDYDFSRVRVHADAQAAASASSINALAYTSGTHVVFGQGEYAPSTSRGQHLLAHELAHVVQQRGESVAIQRMAPCPGSFSSPPPAGWKPYNGPTSVFHCGFRGILEDRIPTRDDPQNECFYDNSGVLVTENHPFGGCRGTPNQYDSASSPILHALIDSGGIVRSGGGAFGESRVHDGASWLGGLEAAIRRLYGVP